MKLRFKSFYISQDIFRINNLRNIRILEHVACIGKLARPTGGWEDNIKKNLEEIVLEVVY
jgi:hypothetical protein